MSRGARLALGTCGHRMGDGGVAMLRVIGLPAVKPEAGAAPARIVLLGRDGFFTDTRIKFTGAVELGHFSQRDHLDLRGIPGGAELLETLATEIAHRIHRGFQELAWIEFALVTGRD